MRIATDSFIMKDGTQAILRSPESNDADKMLDFLRRTSVESDFLIRYPEEITMTEENERVFLSNMAESENEFMLNAVLGDKVIGNVSISRIATMQKIRHRASLGIAVRKTFWNQGIGKELLQRAITQAAANGFLQVELGVYENNQPARSLYRKAGFQEVGRMPRAFLMKDGTFIDEIQMVKFL